MNFFKIDEMAAGGSTGAGSIAAAPGRFNGAPERRDIRGGEQQWRAGVEKDRTDRAQIAKTREQLEKAKRLKQERKPTFRSFVGRLVSKMSESADLDITGITSQLKGLENKNNYDARNTVTYGVEDDDGNLMKVTVKSEDAKSFENRLSLELGEVENNKIYGYQNSGISLAEVLYNLKDEFNIVDVEFPEIPSDIIYNAGKASLGEQTPPMDQNADMGGNPEEGGMEDMGGDMPPGDAGGDAGMPPANGDMEGMPPEEGEEEFDDQGEEFSGDMGGENDFKSLFQELVGLMTANAEAEKAKADAEAEKARALQAEYTSKAANHEVSRQEELIRMEAEVDQQKKREKEAKKYADLAKYRVNQNRGSGAMNFEGYTSFLDAVINEDMGLDSDLESENSVRNAMRQAKEKYQLLATDDDATRQYKQRAFQAVNNQLQAKLKQIRDKKIFDQAERNAAIQQAQKDKAAQQQQQGQPGQITSQIPTR